MRAAVALLLAVAGWRSLTLLAFAAIGLHAVLAGGCWFLANGGLLQVVVLALALMVLTAHGYVAWP